MKKKIRPVASKPFISAMRFSIARHANGKTNSFELEREIITTHESAKAQAVEEFKRKVLNEVAIALRMAEEHKPHDDIAARIADSMQRIRREE